MSFADTSLWKSTLLEIPQDRDQSARSMLRNAYLDLRRMTAKLVENISTDLKQYTIHDITHLDSLWGIASEIVGSNYQLTPTEAFVLGGAFLLHDAGMCLAAYPGGMEDIEHSKAWPTALRSNTRNFASPTLGEKQAAIIQFLRTEHANRALDLPHAQWKTPDGQSYFLIEQTEIRHKFGQFIGQVAASHWWSHEKLVKSLDRTIPAPPPFPTDWRVDLLKIACILRVSDAAHIDERRAPGFVLALRRKELGSEAARHWTFQNKLTQPERREDAIHYSSTSYFQIEEADAWWLAYDTMSMINEELRCTDVVLADLRRVEDRFCARRVANIESTKTAVNSIQVAGWIPIDTKIKISNIPSLVKKLGGEALYGNNKTVPLRELVQNAADAIRLRSAIISATSYRPQIKVSVGRHNGRFFFEVSDNGIGMSEEIIIGKFLDFGNAGWLNDPCFVDYPNIDPTQIRTIGNYGIGFFSVFMLGNEIEVKTRRFDKGFSETLVLSFHAGIDSRPLLRPAFQNEWLVDGGTTVRIWLGDFKSIGDVFGRDKKDSLKRICCQMFPALDVPIEVNELGKIDAIDCCDWRTAEPERLLLRISGLSTLPKEIKRFSSNMRSIVAAEDKVMGRMFLAPETYQSEVRGVIGAKGILAGSAWRLCGFAEGSITTATRDKAIPNFNSGDMRQWLIEQATLLSKIELSVKQQNDFACTIRRLGGDTGDLKICLARNGAFSKHELASFMSTHDDIIIISDYELMQLREFNPFGKIFENVIGVTSGMYSVFDFEDTYDNHDKFYLPGRFECDDDYTMEGLLYEIAMEIWDIEINIISQMTSKRRRRYGSYTLPYTVALAENGQEIKARGIKIFRGMTMDELEKIADRAACLSD